MAAKSQWSCPNCCDDGEDIAYMSPCPHQICVGCAMRWVRQKANCPLCRSRTTAILFSRLSDDDYLMFDVPRTAESSDEDDEDQHGAARPVPRPEVGGFPPEVWADFFKSHPNNTRPLLPWLRGELEALAENEWWEVDATEATVVAHLCLWGLDEEALVRQLQDNVPEDTRTFVRQLIAAAAHLCGREIRLHLGQQDPHAEWGEDESSASSASPTASRGGTPAPHPAYFSSPAGSDVEDQPSTSEAALHWGCSCPPTVPIPEEQEQPQEEPGQAVAGPSAQGCSPSPSAPGRGGNRSPGGSQRPPKRRNPSPPESPPPCKRPPHRRH